MSDEELQLLITLDDPVEAPEEDTFNHLQAKNSVDHCLGRPFPAWLVQPAAASDNDAHKVTFGQGDWTCTLSRLTSTTNDSMEEIKGNGIDPLNKKVDIEVCVVTQRKNGEIVEQKMFYDLVEMQKYFRVT